MQHRALGRAVGRLGEAVGLLDQLVFDFLRQVCLLNAVEELVDLAVAVVAQLILNDLHLLAQIEVTLVLVETCAHLLVNVHLAAQDLFFAFEDGQHVGKAVQGVELFKNCLLVFVFDDDVGGDEIGEQTGIALHLCREDHLVGDLRHQLDHTVKRGVCLPHQRLAVNAGIGGNGGFVHGADERADEFVVLGIGGDLGARSAFKQDAHAAFGGLDRLLDLGNRADTVQIVRRRLVDRYVGLRDQHDAAAKPLGDADRADGFFTGDLNAHRHGRKCDHTAQGDDRKIDFFGLGNDFSHICFLPQGSPFA